jgi:hypothetical protein
MTGPFVRVQETKLFGPTWINVARIVKIQASANGTTIVLEGSGTMQLAEPAETLIGRLDAVLAEHVLPRSPARSPNGTRRAKSKPVEAQDA